MKKTLLISTFLVSIFYHFQVNATELTDALKENKPLPEIQALIKKGIDVNQPDEKTGAYPLMLVKDTAIFQELVNAGADIKAKHEYTSVFHEVCGGGTLEMVQYMIKSGANVNEVIGEGGIKQTPLMTAVVNKDPRVIELLIKSGANIKAKIPSASWDKTVLRTAIIFDTNPEIIKLLIKNGADIHQKNKLTEATLYEVLVRYSSYPELISVFHKAGLDFYKENINLLFLKAMKNGESLEMAKYLLKLGANPNVQAEKMLMGHSVKEDYPIIVAAKDVRPDALNFLLEQKVNVNVKDKYGKTPLELLKKNKYLIKDPNYNKFIVALGGTAISDDETKKSQNSMKLLDAVALYETTLKDVKKLIQEGADVNYKNEYEKTVLMEAINIWDKKTYNEFKGEGLIESNSDYRTYIQTRLNIVAFLLQNGADINAKDRHGKNLLFPAIACKNIQVFKFLVENGADINTKNKQEENLLFEAIRSGTPEILEELLQKGLDINASREDGRTPLMAAALAQDSPDTIKKLLQYGADKTIKDKSGNTAFDYAVYNFDSEIQNLLKIEKTITKYDLSPAVEKFYSESKEGILNEIVLPKVQLTVLDQQKVPSVMKQIENSINMEQIKSDTWPCLSQISEEWNLEKKDSKGSAQDLINKLDTMDKIRNCFKDSIQDIMREAERLIIMANAGENDNLNDPQVFLEALKNVMDTAAHRAMIQHYANSLMMDASMMSILTISANGGKRKDISSSEAKYFKNRKIACGAKLFGKKDGSVIIELPDTCVRMKESDERFDISVDEVIEAAQKDKYASLTCTAHKCIWKHRTSY